MTKRDAAINLRALPEQRDLIDMTELHRALGIIARARGMSANI